MNRQELEEFRQLLLDKRKQVLDSLGAFQKSQEEEIESNGSKYSTHIADEGSDTMAREMAYKLAAQGNKFCLLLFRSLLMAVLGSSAKFNNSGYATWRLWNGCAVIF